MMVEEDNAQIIAHRLAFPTTARGNIRRPFRPFFFDI